MPAQLPTICEMISGCWRPTWTVHPNARGERAVLFYLELRAASIAQLKNQSTMDLRKRLGENQQMANLRKSLEDATARFRESIEAIVIGHHYNAPRGVIACDENIILSVSNGLAKLDVEYHDGFGGADCFPFYAWTASRIFFVAEYDGATSLCWVPRNPMPIQPEFSGQSD